jgi:hypothetical protein
MAVAPRLYRGEAGVGIYVASTGAVPQLADCITDRRAINLLVRIRLVFVRMTPGAIRLVGRKSPSQILIIIGMAAETPD